MIIKPNFFKLNQDMYLFFDIFYKNNKIYLICPTYNEEWKNIKVFFENKLLNLKKKIIKLKHNSNYAKYEPAQIFIYDFEEKKENIIINIEYNEYSKNFNLNHINTNENNEIVMTTLFKDDYKLIPLYYNYYKKLGITKFYLYYNGILNNDIINFFNKDDIILIEWNFHYWNNKKYNYNHHHAQLGQMHHSLYLFGKEKHKYMLFNDLDEFIDLKNNSLKNLINNYDVFGFRCILSESHTKNLFPNEFPDKFNIAQEENFPVKSKWLYNTNIVDSLGIHRGTNYNIKKPIINTDFYFYHFYNWSNTDKRKKHKNPKMIKKIIYKNNFFIIT